MAPKLLKKLKLALSQKYADRVEAREKINSNLRYGELINHMNGVSDDVAKDLAKKLTLSEFHTLVKDTTSRNGVRGIHGKVTVMIASISSKKLDELLTEKGVDPKALNERAEASKRDVEAVRRRALELMLKCPSIPANLITDLAVCSDLLRDGGAVTDLLGTLDEKLEGKVGKHLLSGALREVEKRHKFPDVRAMPVGILTSETFLGMTSWGYQPKDPGAGVEHGEFSHRLQWNALMTQFEKDNQNGIKWDNTPFELFTMLGEIDERAAQNEESSAWGLMMDSQGSNFTNDDTTVSDVKTVRDGFMRPDQLTQGMKILNNINKQSNQKTLPNISELVETRRAKRDNVRKKHEQEYLKKTKTLKELVEKAELNDNGAKQNLQNFLNENKLLIDWKNTDIDTLKITTRNPSSYSSDMAMEEYKDRKLKETDYKLNDESKVDDLLLVGDETEELTNEEKRGNVLKLREESRKAFGLPIKFGKPEQAELLRLINEIVVTGLKFKPEIALDAAKLFIKAKSVAIKDGLCAAIEQIKNDPQLGRINDFNKEWHQTTRKILRETQRLQRALLERNEKQDSYNAGLIDLFIDRLNESPSTDLAEYINEDELPDNIESWSKELQQNLSVRIPLLTLLKNAGLA